MTQIYAGIRNCEGQAIALAVLCILVVLDAANLLAASPPEAEQAEFFEKRIRPILVRHCYECHSVVAKEPKGGLLLDSRDNLRKGGESGTVIIPGKPEESLLISAVRHESLEMPPDKRLPDDVIADLTHWVRSGALDTRDRPSDASAIAAETREVQYDQRRQWWSLQPVLAAPAPEVRDTRWPGGPVDRFILAQLEKNQLHPAPRAERWTLLRRMSFALTGLPPSMDDVEQFAADESPAAWINAVDRLLASPHFGERWARHWMDVVRYTDTYGYEWDIPAKGAWRYRDYLVRALNDDVPFNQLIIEQIAGDLVERPRINAAQHINESLMGVMFFQMGEKRHGDSAEFNGIHQEMLDNKIDAFGKAFQALTLSCARCHDHKLDPVAQREYYALAGVFMSSRWVTNTLDLPERNASVIEQLKQMKSRLRNELAAIWLDDLQKLSIELCEALAEEKAGDDSTSRLATWRKLLAEKKDADRNLEDVLYPLASLVAAARQGDSIETQWKLLANNYAEQQKLRTEQNARDYTLVADFRQATPAGWSVDGTGLRQTSGGGDFTVALSGEAAIGRLLPGGVYTHALSPRMNGAIRTPYLSQFHKPFLSFEHCGGDFAAHRTVVDNAFLSERQQYLQEPAFGWLTLSSQPTMKERRVYIELATKTSNPNFPPRVGLGGECTEAQAADSKSWFGVRRVVVHDKPTPPADELNRFMNLFSGDAPQSCEQVAERYASWFRAAAETWHRVPGNQTTVTHNTRLGDAGPATPVDAASADADNAVQLINWLLDKGLLTNTRNITGHPEVASLVDRYRELEQQLLLPQTINGMLDIDPGFDYRLNIRGEYDQMGDTVPRGYLRVLLGSESKFTSTSSGRLELAKAISDAKNPLTARVFVNRVWHWLFGVGIVATPDDFGHVGDRPSHPELLDHLAQRFATQGWSLKELIREIILSETWRQGQAADLDALAVDPSNRWLHHYPLRRLEAEAIRDAMLFASGRFDPQLYGPPLDPQRPNEDPQKRLFSGPIDGRGRRSLYVKITIMEPPRFLATFNQPTPKIPTGKRDVTTTPAQSLTLLNDPFVSQQAEFWAQRLVTIPHASADERLSVMFMTAFGRFPTAIETQRWSNAVADLASLHGLSAAEILHSVPVWKDIAHAMFNSKEFLYIP